MIFPSPNSTWILKWCRWNTNLGREKAKRKLLTVPTNNTCCFPVWLKWGLHSTRTTSTVKNSQSTKSLVCLLLTLTAAKEFHHSLLASFNLPYTFLASSLSLNFPQLLCLSFPSLPAGTLTQHSIQMPLSPHYFLSFTLSFSSWTFM